MTDIVEGADYGTKRFETLLGREYGQSTTAAHFADEEILAVGGEYGAAQAATAVFISVHGLATEIQLHLPIDHKMVGIMKVIRVTGADVDNANGVVPPMRDGDPFIIRRAGDHLRKGAGGHHSDNLVGARVDDTKGGGLLRIRVETPAVIGDPQKAPIVRQAGLNGLAQEMIRVRG